MLFFSRLCFASAPDSCHCFFEHIHTFYFVPLSLSSVGVEDSVLRCHPESMKAKRKKNNVATTWAMCVVLAFSGPPVNEKRNDSLEPIEWNARKWPHWINSMRNLGFVRVCPRWTCDESSHKRPTQQGEQFGMAHWVTGTRRTSTHQPNGLIYMNDTCNFYFVA